NTLYTAEAHVTGGRANGHGRTGEGMLEVDLRLPKEMGGQGDGTNPEELFAVGYAACFEGALGVAGRRGRLSAEREPRRLAPERGRRGDGEGDREGRAQSLPVLERHARQH